MKKNNKNLLKHIIIIVSLFFIYTLVSAFSYANTVSKDLSQSVFRLHVLANSDNVEDQSLKYKVRDNVLSYMNDLCLNTKTKKEAIEVAKKHQDEFYKIAKQTIQNNGYNYEVNVQIGSFDFPTKQYGDISFPAGFYDALRIEIGEAKGQNWWCVMFPSLCFIDVSSGVVDNEAKEHLEENLEQESYTIISETQNSNVKFKFKLIEFFSENGLFKIAKTSK